MIKRRSQLLTASFLVCDLLMICLAWCGAYYIRFELGFIPITKPVPDAVLCWVNVPLILFLAAVSFQVTGQYAIHRLRRLREEVIGVLKGVTLLALLAMAAIFLRHDAYESRPVMVLFWASAFVLVLTARRCAWAAVRTLRSHGYNQSYSLIVGVGRVARKTARALRKASWMGIKNVGFVEDRHGPLSSDLDVLGAIADLPQLIQLYSVSNVFIALPLNRYADARRVFDVLSQSLVEVRLVADVPILAGLTLTTTNLDGLPVVGLRESPHFGLNVVFKRFMDVLLSLIGLVVLSPLLLLVAAIVKLTSPGPVFYGQERCGLNGRAFHMLKFRSMAVNAEQQTGAVWAVKDDKRRTWFGAFLRRSSIDELPQLWNVLMGDMSLVGPRPERPVFVQQFKKTIPNYMARHCVKAGLTGWAQVNGWRGNTSLRKRLQYDLYYITHWTPWLDLRILWMTLFKGIVHRNAY
ncbi:MAG TPA: undecaprenyl-phosphate glucose phosphotransferase [Gemmataceae bacterium]|nr:undecaprenyl-phosphate glucose phosphotransferase [Gemmataceae bacterium]